MIIATFQQINCFSGDLRLCSFIISNLTLNDIAEENHDPLRSQCALAAAKLLKKPDQCRGVLAVSHLFWSGASQTTGGKPSKDSKKVLDCLKKGVKIAKQCMDPLVQVQLFVEILNHYVLFYEAGCDTISLEMLGEIVKIISEELAGLEETDDSQQIAKHFTNTVEHIKLKRDADGSTLYKGLEL